MWGLSPAPLCQRNVEVERGLWGIISSSPISVETKLSVLICEMAFVMSAFDGRLEDCLC